MLFQQQPYRDRHMRWQRRERQLRPPNCRLTQRPRAGEMTFYQVLMTGTDYGVVITPTAAHSLEHIEDRPDELQ
jgi:hypothetical protein